MSRSGMRIAVGLFLIWCAGYAFGGTYYVDLALGNDANSGSSPASPWKYSPGMAAYSGSGSLSPGDVVYFSSHGTWGVTGTQGIYLVGGVTYIGDSWGSGVRAKIRADGNLEGGVVRFRDHPVHETVFQGFDVDANGKVATGIDFNHRWASSLMNGATKRIDNSVVHNVWSRQSLGQYKYGIVISNRSGADYVVENVEVLNTVVRDISRDGIALYPGDANAECRIANITVRGSVVYNTGQDPDYSAGSGIAVKGYVQDAIIEYNHVRDTNGPGILVISNERNHYGVRQDNIHIRYNIVSNGAKNHAAIMIYDTGAGDPKNVRIYGNLVYNTPQGGITLLGLTNDVELWIYNNTLYNSPVNINASSANYIALELRNNIMYSPGGTSLYDPGRHITGQSNNITSDPLFVDASAPPSGFNGSYGTDLTPNTDGLAVRSESPAVDAGMALGGELAGSINSVARPSGNAWDIGAYELDSGSQGFQPRTRPPQGIRLVR